MDFKGLSKSEIRKHGMLLKLVSGDEQAAKQMFDIWKSTRPIKPEDEPDEVADQIAAIVTKHFPEGMNLGNFGYSIKRAKGKGADGYVVFKNLSSTEQE